MDESDIEDFEEIISGDISDVKFEIKKKITLPKMTNYEKCIIISERVNQLNLHSSIDIAIKEFELGKLPEYKVIRTLPNGCYEVWKHEDFKFFP